MRVEFWSKQFPHDFDHEYEMFNGNFADLQFQSLRNDALAGRLVTVHSEGIFTTTLPLFLLGAGDNAYYAAPHGAGTGEISPADPGWVQPAWDEHRPEYSKKLGAPLGPAAVKDSVARRMFASGTNVTMNLTAENNNSGCIYWSDGTLTGLTSVCGGWSAQ